MGVDAAEKTASAREKSLIRDHAGAVQMMCFQFHLGLGPALAVFEHLHAEMRGEAVIPNKPFQIIHTLSFLEQKAEPMGCRPQTDSRIKAKGTLAQRREGAKKVWYMGLIFLSALRL
jgi:hypothetical protein